MPQIIPKEILREVYERSSRGDMDDAQCAVWLPDVCAMVLGLLQEAEARERAMVMVQRGVDIKRNRTG